MHKSIESLKTLTGKPKEKGLPGPYDLLKIWNPSWFQGNRRQKNYFEGWYIKMATADLAHSWAFIPGMSLSPNDDHAFVQAINGKTGQTWYFRYPLEAFSYSKKGFAARIANSYFSASEVILDLHSDAGHFEGKLLFSGHSAYRAGLRRPGIMGWYRYLPFMECYHGVVSLDHAVEGRLNASGQEVVFDGGRGYIEKDWGSAMPQAWIWMQTNHFAQQPGTSFMLSVARIPPVFNKSFTGFLGYVLHKGRRHDFATYTGARMEAMEHEKDRVRIRIAAKDFRLEITGIKGADGALKAPTTEGMQRMIHESIDASIHIRLSDRRGRLLFEGTGNPAGLELVGDTEKMPLP